MTFVLRTVTGITAIGSLFFLVKIPIFISARLAALHLISFFIVLALDYLFCSEIRLDASGGKEAFGICILSALRALLFKCLLDCDIWLFVWHNTVIYFFSLLRLSKVLFLIPWNNRLFVVIIMIVVCVLLLALCCR